MTDNKGSSSLYGTNYFSFRRSRRTLIFGEADLSTSARLKWCFNELVRGYNRFMHSVNHFYFRDHWRGRKDIVTEQWRVEQKGNYERCTFRLTHF